MFLTTWQVTPSLSRPSHLNKTHRAAVYPLDSFNLESRVRLMQKSMPVTFSPHTTVETAHHNQIVVA